MQRFIAESKHAHFSKKAVWIEVLIVRYLLRYTNQSFNSLSVSDTTIYWGGSLVEKIITRAYFVMQSAYFLYYRSRNPQSDTFQNRLDWNSKDPIRILENYRYSSFPYLSPSQILKYWYYIHLWYLFLRIVITDSISYQKVLYDRRNNYGYSYEHPA
jgi:hypothetical protein